MLGKNRDQTPAAGAPYVSKHEDGPPRMAIRDGYQQALVDYTFQTRNEARVQTAALLRIEALLTQLVEQGRQ